MFSDQRVYDTHCVAIYIHRIVIIHRICQPEQYSFKIGTQDGLAHYVRIMKSAEGGPFKWDVGHERFCRDFLSLARLFAFMIWQDSWSYKHLYDHPWMNDADKTEPVVMVNKAITPGDLEAPYCRFCRCCIWNIHIRCNNDHGIRKPYIICVDCYAQGRGCVHRSTTSVSFCQRFSLMVAIQLYKEAVRIWNSCTSLFSVIGFVKLDSDWKNE